MTKREIRKLAQASYNTLDEKSVDQIVSLLNRKDLKEFIRQLKLIDRQQEVVIALTSLKSYNKGDKFFESIFKNKRIIYQEDPSLILGSRITDNDIVYDFSLKTKLDEVSKNLYEEY